ncbi:WD domain, G-beta repeat protein [Ancylostoma ceylanicum]|uniref:WD domain, G-beta repeat protein n=1 Tax=Ancylostoma ceylanicum TaxID=53326 RepID=A0A0D6LFI3_9BILA|nr:WD domain, G-beta repeat protein [Ancylostoma ceylanicum]
MEQKRTKFQKPRELTWHPNLVFYKVLSVEWSSDGRFLASASMDNTVVVWNARKLPERIVILDTARGGHNGPVKGLSWDPIGKYLATQSADKSLRLWTTDNWQCDTVITKPFSQYGSVVKV